MAVAAYDTQQGATVTLATDSLTLRIVSTTPIRRAITPIRTVHLGTVTNETFTPGELRRFEPVTIMYQNSPGVAQPSIQTVQTATFTGPTASGASVPESVTGTGFIISDDPLPGFTSESEGLQMKQAIWVWDGLTGPTRTVSS